MNTDQRGSPLEGMAFLMMLLSSVFFIIESCSGMSRPPCGKDEDCPPGHSCILEQGICDTYCDPSLCTDRQTCESELGVCISVECDEDLPCVEPGQICDVYVRRCYAENGDCSNDGLCPNFDGRASTIAKARCDRTSDFFCLLESKHIDLPFYTPDVYIDVTNPSQGTIFEGEDGIQFNWTRLTSTSSIAIVLSAIPDSEKEFKSVAIWGVVKKKNEPAMARWEDGKKVEGVVWLDECPPAPIDIPLYFLVQAVQGGKVRAMSAVIPFLVGSDSEWPTPDTSCSKENQVPGDCAHPGIPQICLEGKCKVLCLSHRDCQPYGSMCGVPRLGVRVCGG